MPKGYMSKPQTAIRSLRAWMRDGDGPIIRAGVFQSPIFTVTAGAEKKCFTAHAAMLVQSPVFEKMCYGTFKENHDCQIELPDDSPEVIECMIQYMYSGDFFDFDTTDLEKLEMKLDEIGKRLANVYIAAEKYQLEDLKALVTQELEQVTDVEERSVAFLETAKMIYNGCADPSNVYRAFFAASATLLPNPGKMSERVREAFNECLQGGGFLAVDLTTAVCTANDDLLDGLTRSVKRERVRVKELQDDCTMGEWKIEGLENEIGDLEKKLDELTNKYDAAIHQKKGLVTRLRAMSERGGGTVVCPEREHLGTINENMSMAAQ